MKNVEGNKSDLVEEILTLPPALGGLDHLFDGKSLSPEAPRVHPTWCEAAALLPQASPPAALTAPCCSSLWNHICSCRVARVGLGCHLSWESNTVILADLSQCNSRMTYFLKMSYFSSLLLVIAGRTGWGGCCCCCWEHTDKPGHWHGTQPNMEHSLHIYIVQYMYSTLVSNQSQPLKHWHIFRGWCWPTVEWVPRAGIPYLSLDLEVLMFVLWLNRIFPNLPIWPQGFWFPAVEKDGDVRSERPSELWAKTGVLEAVPLMH